jgi:predicted TIM-barrel fold metal-dependent hydrolase
MPTRRDILIGAAAAGAAALVRPALTVFAEDSKATASADLTPVNFKVPAGACDCHVHIFDAQRFSFSPLRTYTPEPATVKDLKAMHRALHIQRTVVVQPSVYGTDNSCALDAVKQLGANARGVAVIDDNTSDAALGEMHRAGVRGIRFIFQTANQTDPAVMRQRLQAAVERIKAHNWHVQIYIRMPLLDDLKDQLMAFPAPLVFDHFGGAQAALGVEQPGFGTLLKLVQAGKAYVKISGAYRSSTQAPDYADAAPLARALIAANRQRILWGTDWPHPDSAPVEGRKPTDIVHRLPVDDGRLLNLLATWAPDAALRRTILVENPARLYFSS